MLKVTISKDSQMKSYDPANIVLVWTDPVTGKKTKIRGTSVAWKIQGT